jgi:hypothetical protein
MGVKFTFAVHVFLSSTLDGSGEAVNSHFATGVRDTIPATKMERRKCIPVIHYHFGVCLYVAFNYTDYIN